MLASFLAIVALILLSAFFSSTEIAYASASEVRLRQASENGAKAQKRTYWIFRHYDEALTTILMGNNLTNIASSSIATMIVMTLLGDGYAWVSTLAMTVLLLIFGEIVPKVLAKQSPEAFATAVSLPLRALMWLTHPLVRVAQGFVRLISRLWAGDLSMTLTGVTEGDLEILLDTAEEEGVVDENTTELLLSAMEFDDVMAQAIITPRVDMMAIDIDDDIENIVQAALTSPYTRIPVFEGSKDAIIGVLHLNRFLKHLVDDPRPSLRDLLMPVCFVPRTALLPTVLSTMRTHNCHMVVVIDEYGGTLGILTMEDVLEELVGDIWDESDEIKSELRMLPDGRYEASGDMRIHDFFDELDMDDRSFDYESETLGGWAAEMLGMTPKAGDTFEYEGLTFTVEALAKRRVTKLLVSK